VAKRKAGGLDKKLDASEALYDLTGKMKLSRAEATKAIWDYIKKHDLQNPDNMRNIIPDDKLATIIGDKEITMFQLAGILSEHLS